VIALLLSGVAAAQRSWWRNEISTERNGVPNWEFDEDFKSDAFTFVRIKYESYGGGDVVAVGGVPITATAT
jgi:hypothetical protein